ncbi:MAG: hypothetical protein CMN28_14435 [Salinisphaeraceae bacterium]|nr:hypothetical protein [Salinisphaeraceae bacterium]
MHIRKYDIDYGRRKLLQNTAMGAGAGVLMPYGMAMAQDTDVQKAWPDELWSVEAQTKGKFKPGDMITKDNVEDIKHLLDDSAYLQIKEEGREIRIKAPERDISKMFNAGYYEATMNNLKPGNEAKLDSETGNVVTQSGKPYGGGLPFPNPKTGQETWANLAMSWGRADANCYAIQQWDFNGDGKLEFRYDFQWVELQMQGRLDGKAYPGHENEIRRQSVYFASSQDVRGTAFLSNWPYDQRKIPELYGYLPQFRRVRQFPANQRFEPLIPGSTWFLTDPWGAGDPYLTWGNYKIIERKPMLGAWNGNVNIDRENWEPVEQASNNKFWETEYEMTPECIVVECEPTAFPRSPISKKRVYVDTRNSQVCAAVRYDKQGKLWANFEMAFAQFKKGDQMVPGWNGKDPAWSWTYVMIYDHQSKRQSRTHNAERGTGIEGRFAADQDWLYETYCTQGAIQALGTV